MLSGGVCLNSLYSLFFRLMRSIRSSVIQSFPLCFFLLNLTVLLDIVLYFYNKYLFLKNINFFFYITVNRFIKPIIYIHFLNFILKVIKCYSRIVCYCNVFMQLFFYRLMVL